MRKLAQGRDALLTVDGELDGPHHDGWNDHDELHPLDDLRVVVERLADRHAWLTSATLSLVTLRAYPEIELDGVPSPQAGATPDQARGWPALWFAGERDHFPEDGDTHTRAQPKEPGPVPYVRQGDRPAREGPGAVPRRAGGR